MYNKWIQPHCTQVLLLSPSSPDPFGTAVSVLGALSVPLAGCWQWLGGRTWAETATVSPEPGTSSEAAVVLCLQANKAADCSNLFSHILSSTACSMQGDMAVPDATIASSSCDKMPNCKDCNCSTDNHSPPRRFYTLLAATCTCVFVTMDN